MRPTDGHDSGANFTPRGHSARRLRDLLRSAVVRGYFPDGTLPSEPDLMRTHNMSRGAVRDALNLLREEGLVSRVQGLGTFVVSPAALTRMVESHGMRPEPVSPVWNGEQRPHIIDCSVVPTPEAVATRLAPTVTDTCLRVEYVATLHGQPMGMACNYVSFPEGEALLEVQLDTDWYAYLRAAGLTVGSSEFLIGCAAADGGVARLLDVPVGRPVLTLEQLICDEDGRPFNVAFCNSRSDRFGLVSIAVSERLQARAGQRVRFEVGEAAPTRPEPAGFLVDREPANSAELHAWLQQSSAKSRCSLSLSDSRHVRNTVTLRNTMEKGT